jgi:CspA family cold shock protein
MASLGELGRARGTVRFFDVEEGWGVVDSEATPGGAWVHFSAVMIDGLRSLGAGQAVEFRYHEVDQDGYRFRAEEVWPAGGEAVPPRPLSASGGYLSVFRFDEDAPQKEEG